MRHFIHLSILLLAGLTITPLLAEPRIGQFGISSHLALTPRGVISSDTAPTLDVTAFSVEFDDQNNANIAADDSAGLAQQDKPGLRLNLGVIRASHPGWSGERELDFSEYFLGASYKIQSLGINARYSVSSDFGGTNPANGSNDPTQYLAGALTYDLPHSVVAAAHYGHSDGARLLDNTVSDNYNDYSLGLSKEILGFGFDLSFHGNDRSGRKLFNATTDEQVVLKINKNF